MEINGVFDVIALFVGPSALIYFVVSMVQTRRFLRRCTEVPGEVIQLKYVTGTRGGTYAPVFSFTAADGNTYTMTSDVSSSPAGFRVGQSVRVRYDPADPENARIHSFFQTWGKTFVSGAVGIALTGYLCNALGLLHFAN